MHSAFKARHGSGRLRNGMPAVYINVSAYEQNGPDDPHADVTLVEIGTMEQKRQPQ
jgi:hypothetical protein